MDSTLLLFYIFLIAQAIFCVQVAIPFAEIVFPEFKKIPVEFALACCGTVWWNFSCSCFSEAMHANFAGPRKQYFTDYFNAVSDYSLNLSLKFVGSIKILYYDAMVQT